MKNPPEYERERETKEFVSLNAKPKYRLTVLILIAVSHFVCALILIFILFIIKKAPDAYGIIPVGIPFAIAVFLVSISRIATKNGAVFIAAMISGIAPYGLYLIVIGYSLYPVINPSLDYLSEEDYLYLGPGEKFGEDVHLSLLIIPFEIKGELEGDDAVKFQPLKQFRGDLKGHYDVVKREVGEKEGQEDSELWPKIYYKPLYYGGSELVVLSKETGADYILQISIEKRGNSYDVTVLVRGSPERYPLLDFREGFSADEENILEVEFFDNIEASTLHAITGEDKASITESLGLRLGFGLRMDLLEGNHSKRKSLYSGIGLFNDVLSLIWTDLNSNLGNKEIANEGARILLERGNYKGLATEEVIVRYLKPLEQGVKQVRPIVYEIDSVRDIGLFKKEIPSTLKGPLETADLKATKDGELSVISDVTEPPPAITDKTLRVDEETPGWKRLIEPYFLNYEEPEIIDELETLEFSLLGNPDYSNVDEYVNKGRVDLAIEELYVMKEDTIYAKDPFLDCYVEWLRTGDYTSRERIFIPYPRRYYTSFPFQHHYLAPLSRTRIYNIIDNYPDYFLPYCLLFASGNRTTFGTELYTYQDVPIELLFSDPRFDNYRLTFVKWLIVKYVDLQRFHDAGLLIERAIDKYPEDEELRFIYVWYNFILVNYSRVIEEPDPFVFKDLPVSMTDWLYNVRAISYYRLDYYIMAYINAKNMNYNRSYKEYDWAYMLFCIGSYEEASTILSNIPRFVPENDLIKNDVNIKVNLIKSIMYASTGDIDLAVSSLIIAIWKDRSGRYSIIKFIRESGYFDEYYDNKTLKELL